MWLRDHLPHHPEFRRCRVMTYGYNSALSDKTSMATQLSDLADGLLMSLGNHRSTDGERSRPLLLICHSMGGIVARLAMTQYHRWGTQKYTGVALGHCGLLLLSTPNAGSKLADWPDLMVALAGVVAGVRGNLVDELRIFNGKTGQQVNDWMKIPEPRPMIRCFCEESLTGSYQVSLRRSQWHF